MIIDALFKSLRKDGILKLITLKEHTLKDLLVSTPEMIAAAFSKQNIVKFFISAGIWTKNYIGFQTYIHWLGASI